jgi:hypothetical protein
MKYTLYNQTTGQIQRVYSDYNEETTITTCQGLPCIVGEYSERDYYIENGQAVKKPAKPIAFNVVYTFDYETKTWIVDQEKSQQQVRQLRDKDLAVIDKINPIWYSSLSTTQQQELQQYRQQLLDIPQQTGFPINVVWPIKPSWL